MRRTCCFVLYIAVMSGGIAGCEMATQSRELDVALSAMQQLYGPPGATGTVQQYAGEPVSIDLNGDGQEEIVVLLGDAGLGVPPRFDVDGGQVICRGFLVLREVDGRYWPLFYYDNEYRTSIEYFHDDQRRGIVRRGGRDGEFVFWGWYEGGEDWPPARWESRRRTWNEAEGGYGPWQGFPPVASIYGK